MIKAEESPADILMRPVGRFAPSPTGRMHLGNIFTALISWLSVRSRGGHWILRIEDLDPQRSRLDYARMIEEDLDWLGLDWDEGGIDGKGTSGPYLQSARHMIYESILNRLRDMGLTYPCRCTRADIKASQAPHQSDGRIVYAGTCRPPEFPFFRAGWDDNYVSERLYVPDRIIRFNDRIYGTHEVNLTSHCGDFVVRRADGAWAYQLAVVADDALMGVTEVVRGSDLLLSAAQQSYLYSLLGFNAPEWAHLPLICNRTGQRLSKRDSSTAMDSLRRRYTAREIIGLTAYIGGLTDHPTSCTPAELTEVFDWSLIRPVPSIILPVHI